MTCSSKKYPKKVSDSFQFRFMRVVWSAKPIHLQQSNLQVENMIIAPSLLGNKEMLAVSCSWRGPALDHSRVIVSVFASALGMDMLHFQVYCIGETPALFQSS